MTDKIICCRCKQKINKDKDRWVNVRDFDKGKNVGEKNIHLHCWKNMARESIQKAFDEKAKQIFPMIRDVIGNIGMVQDV